MFYKFFFIIYKNGSECLFNLLSKKSRCDTVILNRAKGYNENDKKRLREQARDKYRNLSEQEKNKNREYGQNRYLNMSEEKKKRLNEYQKKLSWSKKISVY